MRTDPSGFLSPIEQRDVRLRAQKRALDRVEEREHLRLELKARAYITTCHDIAETLTRGYEDRVTQEGDQERVELSRARVQSLKAAAEISLRLLDRVLPPLKAVEVNDSPEKTLDDVHKMSDAELAMLIRKQRAAIPGEYRVVDEEERPFG